MKRLIVPLLLIACVALSASCTEKTKRGKKTAVVARTLDDYAGMPGGVVRNIYADSTPRDILFYRVDEQGNLTDEVVREVHCYDNKNIYIEGAIKHDERDGVLNAYFKNGRLQATQTYNEGVQVGEEKVYYENGTLMYKGQYDNGICTGKWEFFDESGVRTQSIIADDTTIVCRSCPKCLQLMGKVSSSSSKNNIAL